MTAFFTPSPPLSSFCRPAVLISSDCFIMAERLLLFLRDEGLKGREGETAEERIVSGKRNRRHSMSHPPSPSVLCLSATASCDPMWSDQSRVTNFIKQFSF